MRMTSAWCHPWVIPSLVSVRVLLCRAHWDQRPSTSIRPEERRRKWTTCLTISLPNPSEPERLFNKLNVLDDLVVCVSVWRAGKHNMLLLFGGYEMSLSFWLLPYICKLTKDKGGIFFLSIFISVTCCPQCNLKGDIMHLKAVLTPFIRMQLRCELAWLFMEICTSAQNYLCPCLNCFVSVPDFCMCVCECVSCVECKQSQQLVLFTTNTDENKELWDTHMGLCICIQGAS